ncbi:TlpA disulfide reductase family protein [Butyricimonas hominis]|uniref:thioredoxin-like domain-containing protein n=1 Tax=Butyricimonas TaxID=574697 RepID=UPI0035134F47
MNRIFFFIAALLLCGACTSRPEGFVIRGNFPGLQDGMLVTLRSMEGEAILATDTIQDGKFELQGVTASPQYCNLLISSNTSSPHMGKMVNIYMFLDNSELTVNTAHFDSLQFIHPFVAETAESKARVEGGPLQREYYEYRDALMPLLLAASEVNIASATLNMQENQYTTEEFNNRFDELYPKKLAAEAAIDAAKMEFIRQHPQSPVSLFIAEGLLNTTFTRTPEEIKELTRIAKQIEDSVRRPRVLKMAEIASILYKGASYKDIELTNPTGETVKLSQYILPDHYTLVDFWASWCGPCRWAIPKVDQIYEHSPKDRLTVISVSFDQKKTDWETAMKEEAMPWTQLWTGNRDQVTAAQRAYNISGIPRLMLIAPDGKIVFSGNDANALRVTVEEYLEK